MKANYTAANFIQNIELNLRSCACCGRSFGAIDLFCASCWIETKKFLTFSRVELAPKVFLYYLFDWHRASDKYVSCLIYALKGGGLRAANAMLAAELIRQRVKVGPRGLLATQIVPVPGSKSIELDHAGMLGYEIARLLQIPLLSCLAKEKQADRQHMLSKTARQKIKFSLKQNKRSLLLMKNTIIVDDVVTTGASVLAAYEALNKPDNCEAWAISRRW
jgi:predicted amidophosphoribosyltransferase